MFSLKWAACPIFGLLIDIGALVSLFAGNARLHHGGGPRPAADVAPRACARLASRHCTNATRRRFAPSSSRELPPCPSGRAGYRGSSGLDVYGWMGSLATYGFIVTYALVCVALPHYLRATAPTAPARKLFRGSRRSRCCWRWWESLPRARGPLRKTALCLSGVFICRLLWFFVQRRGENAPQVERDLCA